MTPKMTLDQPGIYQITVQGKLAEPWAEYFEGMQMEWKQAGDGSPLTIMTGLAPDQAAVQGMLQKLYNLGFPLLCVVRKDEECAGSSPDQP
jgi:hypothetical protein